VDLFREIQCAAVFCFRDWVIDNLSFLSRTDWYHQHTS